MFARGSRPDCQKTALTTFFFLLVLNLFYSYSVVYQWFISKKTIIFQGFRAGGPTFSSVGGPAFSRRGGGASKC